MAKDTNADYYEYLSGRNTTQVAFFATSAIARNIVSATSIPIASTIE
ncbi:hypothetical protein [Candidatus Methanoperedens sp. BLZ2]|nr:hypothetical protein [Candidatus Methanoperedens sp. BLZ2]MBZ0174875.1 hypothetical protein [Candidatus Methanoperedens nitroreducens]